MPYSDENPGERGNAAGDSQSAVIENITTTEVKPLDPPSQDPEPTQVNVEGRAPSAVIGAVPKREVYHTLRRSFDEASIVAEQRLLGWFIACADIDAAHVVAHTMEPDDFCDPLHQQIFTNVLAALKGGAAPSLAELKHALAESAAFREFGNPDYLYILANAAPAVKHGEPLAAKVRENHLRRAGSLELAALADDLLRTTVPFADSQRRAADYLHAAAKRLRTVPESADVFTFDGKQELQPPDMLVDGVVPKEGVVFVAGQSGAGKTFIAVDLAHSLATGKPFFGRKVKHPIGVAFVAAEGSGMFPHRVAAVRQEKSPEAKALALAWIGSAPSLDSDIDLEAFTMKLREADSVMRKQHGIPLGVVIFDTVAASFDLENEDSNSEAARTIRKVRDLARRADVLIILVHHHGKAPANGMRGASAWRGGADVVLSVMADQKDIAGETKNRKLICSKNRDGEEGPITAFELRKVVVAVAGDGSPVYSCVVEACETAAEAPAAKGLSDRVKVALNALVDIVDKVGTLVPPAFGLPRNVRGVPIEEFRKELKRVGIIASPDDKNPSLRFSRIKETLKAKNLAKERDGLIWLVAPA